MNTELSKLAFPKDYFCDEVRDGFYVSETMKHYWAAQLKVLSVINGICCRHGINWFADSGTLIGAVRHKGFIPWDDDVDISMRRADFESFLAFARVELPDGYCILYADDNKDYRYPFCRIINSNEINKSKVFLNENYGCPFVVGVDIFPLDKIYYDPDKERERVNRGNFVWFAYKGILENRYSVDEIASRINRIEVDNNTVIPTENIANGQLNLFIEISKECNDEKSNEIALMYIWMSEGKYRFFDSYFDEWSEMEFETTFLRVPRHYHEILSSFYGNYMVPVKGTAIHDYPSYRGLEGVYRENFHCYPTRYCFSKDNFTPLNRKTLRQKQNEIISLIIRMHQCIQEMYSSQNQDNGTILLQKCREAVLSVEELIEKKFGLGTKAERLLELYLEIIGEATSGWNEYIKSELDNLLLEVQSKIDDLYTTTKREILFLPCKASWWKSMREVFLLATEDVRNNVNVIPIPYYYRNYATVIDEVHRDIGEFENIPELQGLVTDFDKYDVASRHPDVIVMQYPFDGYSGCMSISDMLYSENLLKYTDELVYIPFLNPNPPESDNDVANLAMLELVEQPAVFYADKVIVNSIGLREFYVKTLISMTDISLQDYWKKRVTTEKEL